MNPLPADLSTLDEAECRALDALLQGEGATKWQPFFENRARRCPFFVPHPDESLAEWWAAGRLPPGRALDIGCGNGRNAVFLARQGLAVDGVDLSDGALAWARDLAHEAGVTLRLRSGSVFELELDSAAYDVVVDSGCFHHIAPHRRRHYVQRVAAALKPGGVLALCCFRPEGGSGLDDAAVYAQRTLGGGLGYSEAQLRACWSQPAAPLRIEAMRPMREPAEGEALFGQPFLWAMLARKI